MSKPAAPRHQEQGSRVAKGQPKTCKHSSQPWEAFAWTRRRRALSNLGTTHPENQTTQGGASKEGTTCRTPPPPNPRRVLGFHPGSGTGVDTGDLSGASKEKAMRAHALTAVVGDPTKGFPRTRDMPPAPRQHRNWQRTLQIGHNRRGRVSRGGEAARPSDLDRAQPGRPRHDHRPPDPRRPSSRGRRPSHPAHAACRRGCAASPSGADAPESGVLRAEPKR